MGIRSKANHISTNKNKNLHESRSFHKTGIIIALADIFVNVTGQTLTITFSKSAESIRFGSTLCVYFIKFI